MGLRRHCAVFAAFTGAVAAAQSPAPPGKLAYVLPTLLERGIDAADPLLRPLLLDTISPNWVSLNASVATQLSNLPIPSPASSFDLYYDRGSGAVLRRIQSEGPVLTERAETIGKGSFFFAVTYQRFLFDHLDDVKLGGLDVAVPLADPNAGASTAAQAVVSLSGSISMSINQVTAHFTVGLTPWLDVSYAFPIVFSSLSVRGGGVLRATPSGASLATLPTQLISASAEGLGDGVVRAKARLFSAGNFKMALATDIRLPTGDELNYLGAGAYGIKPFLIFSYKNRRFSPHLNAGYQWNGASFLASQYANEKRNLPGQIFYFAGFDSALSPRLTASVDYLDQIVIKGQRAFITPLESAIGTLNVLSFDDRTRHEINCAIGFKARIQEHLVLTGNLLTGLNHAGLRARIVPMVGMSYFFP